MTVSSVLADRPRLRSKKGSASVEPLRSGQSIEFLRQLALNEPTPCSRRYRTTLKRRLARVEEQIAVGRQQFANQLELVARIERKHGDSTAARQTLHSFAQAHVIRLDDRDRIARLLEQLWTEQAA